ncbi:MAG: hypothetical protein NTY86_21945 [Deltaproteobacteria bacterium]|jgi:hypothetical protein|nr:hypothetical protein [Deltaproteobacteria bacterium]
MHTLTMMVKDGHIDPDLFALFQKEEIPLDYARRELSLQQSHSEG